jgi:siroheme synthase
VARLRGTVVLLMAVDNAPAIATALVDGGRPASTPVAVIVEGTMPTERTVLTTLGSLADDLVANDDNGKSQGERRHAAADIARKPATPHSGMGIPSSTE